MSAMPPMAPPWQVERWFNTERALTLESLRGKVVALEAFQMLCPGCVSHGLPQAQRIHASFPPEHVAVVGLHTVFEHHAAMTPVSLEAFLHEYRIAFPVGVDRSGTDDPIPQTMQAYGMRAPAFWPGQRSVGGRATGDPGVRNAASGRRRRTRICRPGAFLIQVKAGLACLSHPATRQHRSHTQ